MALRKWRREDPKRQEHVAKRLEKGTPHHEIKLSDLQRDIAHLVEDKSPREAFEIVTHEIKLLDESHGIIEAISEKKPVPKNTDKELFRFWSEILEIESEDTDYPQHKIEQVLAFNRAERLLFLKAKSDLEKLLGN